MNNQQKTPLQQFILIFVMAYVGMTFFNNYFHPEKPKTPPKPHPTATLATAFAGIDPADKTAPPPTAADIPKLEKDITDNADNPYSDWCRLRAGLICQYIVKTAAAQKQAHDFYYAIYKHDNLNDAIFAQSIYQDGDMQWKQALASGLSLHDASGTLEELIHSGRGNSKVLDIQIMVPTSPTATATALPAAFALRKVADLHGTLARPDPQGVLDRVDQYYRTTVFYKIFDAVVKTFGNQPTYSYGLAILFLAFAARLCLQPLNKRQYESMKGMQIIAPEMKKIQKKYEKQKDQASQMKMVTEIRELQARHGVSPMLGCGLAAVQLAFFFVVVYPFILHFAARMALAGASFLWIRNLTYADYPLLGLYAISQFVSMRLAATPAADAQQKQMQQMMVVFPFIMPFFLLSWPSAFTMFWMVFNVVSTFFQYRMMKSADPSKRFFNSLIHGPGDPVPVEAAPNEAVIPARPRGSVKSLTAAVAEETNGAGPWSQNGDTPRAAAANAAKARADKAPTNKNDARQRRRKR